MQNFDPTPSAVTYFRINAVGLSVAIASIFVAMYWWMGTAGFPIHNGWFFGILLLGAALSAGMYFLPAFVPRKTWGYVVAWIQIALSMTTFWATLPTLAVLITFARNEVRDWFDGKPVGFGRDHSTNPAIVAALVGYYMLLSAVPFAVFSSIDMESFDESDAIVLAEGQQVRTKRHVAVKADTVYPEDFRARTLTTFEEWRLSEQDRPVAVTVWATYCGPCQRQLAEIARHGSRLGEETEHVTLAVDCSTRQGKNHGKVRAKLARSGIRSTALCATVDSLDVDAYPTTVFFEADGTRRATLVGVNSHDKLNDIALQVER